MSGSVPMPNSAKRILIVEDDNLAAKIYERTLTKGGYQAEICRDGREALKAVCQRKFDLVLLDIMMPQLNGMDFLNKLRVQNQFRDLPIVLVTCVPLGVVREEAKAAGANRVLSKSQATPQLVLATVNEILGAPGFDAPQTVQVSKNNDAGILAGPALHKQILDAVPVMAFIADEDARVLDANAAAIQEFGVDFEGIRDRHIGELFQCPHSVEAPGGCGHSAACEPCSVRKSVREACQGSETVQMRTKVNRSRAKGMREQNYLVTAVPLDGDGAKRVLLMFEDIGKLLNVIAGGRLADTDQRCITQA